MPVKRPSDRLRPWIGRQNSKDSIPGGSVKRQLGDGFPMPVSKPGTVCEMCRFAAQIDELK